MSARCALNCAMTQLSCSKNQTLSLGKWTMEESSLENSINKGRPAIDSLRELSGLSHGSRFLSTKDIDWLETVHNSGEGDSITGFATYELDFAKIESVKLSRWLGRSTWYAAKAPTLEMRLMCEPISQKSMRMHSPDSLSRYSIEILSRHFLPGILSQGREIRSAFCHRWRVNKRKSLGSEICVRRVSSRTLDKNDRGILNLKHLSPTSRTTLLLSQQAKCRKSSYCSIIV